MKIVKEDASIVRGGSILIKKKGHQTDDNKLKSQKGRILIACIVRSN